MSNNAKAILYESVPPTARQRVPSGTSDRTVAGKALLHFAPNECDSRPAPGWLSAGRNWAAQQIGRTAEIGIAALEAGAACLAREAASGAGIPDKIAAIHLCNGDEFVVAVDAENEDYLNECLGGSRNDVRVAWFETLAGCYVGLNLAQINAIYWYEAAATAPQPSAWDRNHLVVHFVDKEAITLERISSDEIDRLRGATMSKQRAPAFHTIRGRRGSQTSIGVGNLTYIAMPADWLDDDG